MAKDIVPCTLLNPDPDPFLNEEPIPEPITPPVRIVPERASGDTERAGRVPVRLESVDHFESFSSGDALRDLSIEGSSEPARRPVRLDAMPLQRSLDAARGIVDPDRRYVALVGVHDNLQAFITANPGHPSTAYLMERYFHLRSELPADLLSEEFPENTVRLDNFETTRLRRPDGSELVIQQTAEGRRRIEIEPGTVVMAE